MNDPINRLTQDSSSKFCKIRLSEDENKSAAQVSPLFLAYLQNKIEAYASDLVNTTLPYSPNPTEQVAAILVLEKKRSYIEAYEELLAELLDANQPVPNSNQTE